VGGTPCCLVPRRVSLRSLTMSSKLPLIACSLEGDDQRARLAEWTELISHATAREGTDGGVRYSFAPDDELETRINMLAAAEHACCAFLEFDVRRAGDRVELSVNAPADAQEALRFIFEI
jgi:hypothetical protein